MSKDESYCTTADANLDSALPINGNLQALIDKIKYNVDESGRIAFYDVNGNEIGDAFSKLATDALGNLILPGVNKQIATVKEVINWDVSNTSFEYIPKGVQLIVGPLGTNIINIDKSQIPEHKIEILSGNAQINNLKDSPSKVSFGVSANTSTQIKANIFDFPGWRVLYCASSCRTDLP